MKKLAILFLLLLQAGFAEQWSMGFWTAWGPDPNFSRDLDWGGLTHVIEVGIEPQSDGSLRYSDPNFAANATSLVATAHSHNVKALVNIWSAVGSDIDGAVTNNLNTTINNIMNVVNTYGFDGVDIDWEAGRNFTTMTVLIQNLRSRLGTKLLTADAVTNDYAYWGSVASYLDRVNVMTYDMSGNWNPYSWFNAAVYSDACNCVWSFELVRQRMMGAGVPAAKLNMGLPFYGWVSSGGGVTGPRQTWVTPPSLSQINYFSLAATYNIANPTYDSGSQSVYIQTGNGWITYDNEQSLTSKVNYVKNNNLGGWIIWALDQDYLPNAPIKHPLLTAVKNAMGVTSVTGPAITSVSPLAAGTVATSYSQTLAASGSTATWSVVAGSLPSGLSLNAASGQISGTPLVAATSSFTVKASNSAGNDQRTFSLTIDVNIVPPSILSTSPLVTGTVGTVYAQTLLASGTSPTWSVTGTLPPGLALGSSTGVTGGTPTTAGTYNFTVTASNSAGSNQRAFSLTINPNITAPAILSTSPMATGTVGALYAQSLVSSGTAPTWSVTGTLPPGLALGSSTGMMGGTPTTAGTYNFTITASNSAGSNQRAFSLTTNPAPAPPPPPPAAAVVQFIKSDTTTQGSWRQVYGGNGYGIANLPASYPAYAQVTLANQNSWTWADGSTDVRAMQKAGATDRIASTWFADASFRIDANLTDGVSHQVALYMLDWDGGRSQRVDVLDYATGVNLDSRIVSGFSAGQYLVWSLKGHVVIQITNLGGSNAVASGIFFGSGAPVSTARAAYVSTDTSTQGSWRGNYGSSGAIIANESSSIPGFAQVQFAGASAWTWNSSTNDSKALLKSTSKKDRIASAWYGSMLTIDVNLTDGATHQVALYLLDWDSSGRAETVTVSDAATGAVLDTRSMSGLGNGKYLVWNFTGHVTIKVAGTAGPNAVVSGVFF